MVNYSQTVFTDHRYDCSQSQSLGKLLIDFPL